MAICIIIICTLLILGLVAWLYINYGGNNHE